MSTSYAQGSSVMYCPYCSAPTATSASHCLRCGKELLQLAGAHRLVRQKSAEGSERPGQIQPALPPGTLLNGRYRVLRVLGTGAFGRVYLAEDAEEPDHPLLAIKELLAREFASPDDQQDAIAWFKREVSTLLSLEHPGIPAIHGYWTARRAAGPLYLAMDYIPGKTLADVHVLAGGHLPWTQVVTWGISLCDVLSYLHSRMPPFVFRDLKPANVLVDARTGMPVLIDFGLARQLAPLNGTAIGTWGYVPFEQVLGKAEPRSDLYALCAVLHELLTNRHPAGEYRQLLRQGVDVEGALRQLFPPAATLVPTVPFALSQVLLRGTAFAPDDRFANGEALREALRDVLALATPSALRTLALPAIALQPAPDAPPALRAPDAPSTSLLSRLLKPPPPLVGLRDTASSPRLDVPPEPRPPTPRQEAPSGRQDATPGSDDAGSGRLVPHTEDIRPASAEAVSPDVGQAAPSGAVATDAVPAGEAAAVVALLPAPTDPTSPPRAVGEGAGEPFLATAPALAEDPRSTVPDEPTGGTPPAGTPAIAGRPRARRWRFRSSSSGSSPSRLLVSAKGAGDYTSIGAALRRAPAGSQIEVAPGLYREGLILDKVVEISGAGPAEDIVIESADASCVLMHAVSAVLRGVTLRCTAGRGETRYYAVNIPTGSLLIEDCQIRSHSLASIAVHGHHTQPTIRRCTIQSSSERGLIVYSHAGGLIEACDISSPTVCVRISSHAAPMVRACRIHDGNHGGVAFSEHGHGVLESCEIVDNGHHGVTIRSGSEPIIRGCHINRNGWSAISVGDTAGAFVEGCDLTGNKGTSWDIAAPAMPRVRRMNNRELG